MDITEKRDVDLINNESRDQTASSSNQTAFGRFCKRTFDLFGSILALILTSPFWIFISLLIKLTSRGPVFYTQTRVGQNRRSEGPAAFGNKSTDDNQVEDRRHKNTYGKNFKVIKFRTMIHNAEKDSGPVWASKNDSRITALGKILRKLRLDEIPQFLNVLAGDMSIVGPRPERPLFVLDLTNKVDNYQSRLEFKPGITGLAQVKGSYDSSPSTVTEKLKYDLEYINNWSLWLDVKILLRTIIVVLTGKGAH